MLETIGRNLRAWHLWAALTGIVALDLSLLLVTVPRLAEFSSGQTMLDLRLGGYTAKQAGAYLSALGAEGRAYYAGAHFVVDTVFAVLEAVALALLVIWFTRPGARYAIPLPGALRWVAAALPLAAGVMDIRENLLVREMMLAALPPDPALVTAASVATQAKWLLAAGSILIVLLLAAASAPRAKKNARGEPRA